MATPPQIEDGDQPKRFTSLVPGLNLLASALWHRGKDMINRTMYRPPPITDAKSSNSLPHELIEMIIGHFITDIPTLKVCALISRPWYIVVVHYIHHTFVYTGAESLSKGYELGLFPFVKEMRIKLAPPPEEYDHLPPHFLSHRDSKYFFEFKDIQSMTIQNLDVQQFFPDLGHYFGHLAPSLRSLTLDAPRCSPRRLAHFFSLFQNLDDLEIRSYVLTASGAYGEKLIPLSTPTFQGRLTIWGFTHIETWEHLATSCGMRFRSMYLHPVTQNATVLLPACAETLETLWIECNETTALYLRTLEFKCNLSPLKVLRTLQIKAPPPLPPLTPPQEPPINFFTVPLETIFSRITSPVFSEVVIANPYSDGPPDRFPWYICDVLHKMHDTRPFKLELSLIAPGGSDDLFTKKIWEEAVATGAGKGLFSFLQSPPSIRITQGSTI